jgi:hypothetical protein
MKRPFESVRYINLARRPDRRARAEEELARLGWTDAKRVDAVDAASFDPDEWVRRGAVTPSTVRWRTRPEVAVIASHFVAWKEIADEDGDGDGWSLILEDDFRVHPAMVERPEIWTAYWSALPRDAEFVMLGRHGSAPADVHACGERLNPFVFRVDRNVTGSFAYAMTRRFARAHLADYFPLVQVVDSFPQKLSPVYALESIDDARWGCVTPPDFRVVDRSADATWPLLCAGVVSLRVEASDIQYGRGGLVEKLATLRDLMTRGEHAAVRAQAAEAKPELMRQLYPDLYLHFLDICITSYWYVARVEGFALVHRLLESLRGDPRLAAVLAAEAPRICANLVHYRADLARDAEKLLLQ